MKRSSSATSSGETQKQKTIHPFFNRNTDDEMKISWYSKIPSVLIAVSHGKDQAKSKVAAFDLDSTLIATKSGRTFAGHSKDWKWWHPSVPKRLTELHSEGYKIVIFTNQNGLRNEQRIREFKIKATSILSQLPVPVLLYAALNKNRYRKPMTGMWDDMVEHYNADVPIDLEQSFYVGDAAGREDGWKPHTKRDHSCVDRKFAHNIGIKFYTPEHYFMHENEATSFTWGPFNPKSFVMSEQLFSPTSTPLLPENMDQNEMIISVGCPGSGKSNFAEKYLRPKGYVYVNQDTLKTKAKCLKVCEEAMLQKESVVIDNTNSNKAVRADYLNLAKKHGVPARCFYFVADEHLCRHNNYYRHLYQGSRELLGDIVFRTYKSRFEEPALDEGFKEIKKIYFKFEGTENDLSAWRKWYL